VTLQEGKVIITYPTTRSTPQARRYTTL